jgi:hypothetical protein|tara:strand:+ start:203 stop:526 length:324 start_codon:yes stop_codon:yes gene_type:complete
MPIVNGKKYPYTAAGKAAAKKAGKVASKLGMVAKKAGNAAYGNLSARYKKHKEAAGKSKAEKKGGAPKSDNSGLYGRKKATPEHQGIKVPNYQYQYRPSDRRAPIID